MDPIELTLTGEERQILLQTIDGMQFPGTIIQKVAALKRKLQPEDDDEEPDVQKTRRGRKK